MADYRDPKVTTTGSKRDNKKWIGIAVAAVVVLLLIAWWVGAFGTAEVEPVVEAPVTEEPVLEGDTTEGATE